VNRTVYGSGRRSRDSTSSVFLCVLCGKCVDALRDLRRSTPFVAAASRTRFITLNLHEGCSPDAVGLELSDMFNKGSELVQ
jgi:hypothetical protein